MTDRIGAPGTGISRREFLIASGTGGAAALAGCVGSAPNPQLGAKPANLQQKNETLPLTAPPQVVQVNEQGGSNAQVAAVPTRGPSDRQHGWADRVRTGLGVRGR